MTGKPLQRKGFPVPCNACMSQHVSVSVRSLCHARTPDYVIAANRAKLAADRRGRRRPVSSPRAAAQPVLMSASGTVPADLHAVALDASRRP